MNRVEAMARGMSVATPLDRLDILSLESKVSDADSALRVDLPAAYRIVPYCGWDDLIFTRKAYALDPRFAT